MISRSMTKVLVRSALYYPVVAILGPRQSGKTTLARNTFANHKYISLENADMAYHATHDPHDFLRLHANEHGMILDEFQNTPGLLSYMQTYVDEHQKPGYFILTGSQNFLMNEAITQTLAGRIAIHTLLPLTAQELESASLLPEAPEEALLDGFYPPVYVRKIRFQELTKTMPDNAAEAALPVEQWYSDYIRTYVERDIRQLSQVTDLNLFQKFTQLCAARVGQVLNLTSLGNECGVSDATVKKWLSLLEASYIIFLLYPHHKNFSKRIVKSPKIYFYDTGLACALLKISRDLLPVHPFKGNLFESFAITELVKYYYNRGLQPSLYFWRDHTGNEIDCIIDQGLSLIPVEIKSNVTINQKFFDGLAFWQKLTGADPAEGFIIYAGSETQKRSAGTIVSWKDISSIGKQLK